MITLDTPAATAAFAQRLAPCLTPGDVLLLEGDLGAGKTTLARSLIQTLAGDPALSVTSPTFTLVQSYDSPRGVIWHYDLYRLKNPVELEELALQEALESGIVLIEWPQAAEPWCSEGYLRLQLAHGETTEQRRLRMEAAGRGEKILERFNAGVISTETHASR